MNHIIWIRTLGACIATALLLHAGSRLYGEFVLPDFRASDLFAGRTPLDKISLASCTVLSSFSLDGNWLANCAAAEAADLFHHPSTDAQRKAAENMAAQEAAVAALKRSPIRPALWLTLGTLKAQSGEPVTPAFKMSYLTGAVPIEVAFSRVQAVTTSAAATDDEIKLLAQSDIRAALANRSRYEPLLMSAYAQATPQGKSLLLEAAQMIDPKFKDILRRY